MELARVFELELRCVRRRNCGLKSFCCKNTETSREGRCLRSNLEWMLAWSFLVSCEREGRSMLVSSLPWRTYQIRLTI